MYPLCVEQIRNYESRIKGKEVEER